MDTNRHHDCDPLPIPAPPTVFVLFSEGYPNADEPDEMVGVFATDDAAGAEIVRRALAGQGIARARIESTAVQS